MESSNNNSLKVLVVDDDSTCLAIVAAMLKKLKFQVVALKNANDAIVTLRTRGDFDVVISDVYMPDINGFQLQQMIFQEFRVPVVLMSGDTEEGIVRQGMQYGALSFIKKPVSVNDLKGLWRYITAQKKSKITITMEHVNTGTGLNFGSGSNLGSDSTTKKKMVWTDPLHYQFLDALSSLGAENAVPKNILRAMNVPGLTREHVSSHLQKYRQFLRRNLQEIENINNGVENPPKRLSRLARLQQLFAQGQLDAALSSPTSSAALGGNISVGNSRTGQQTVALSEQDELMFYRGLTRDPAIANPNPNPNNNANSPVNVGSVLEQGNYITLESIMEINSGRFLNYDVNNTNVVSGGFGNVNVVSGNENDMQVIGDGSFQMNEQGGDYYDFYAGLINYNYSPQDGGQQFHIQFESPTAPPHPAAAPPVTFSGYGNETDNYNYGGLALSPFSDISMYGNNQDNLGGNQVNVNQSSYPQNQQIGNEYGINNYNSEQWSSYGYNREWYMPAGTSQQNLTQQYSTPAQRDGNEDDDFVNFVCAPNPYGGGGNGEGM